MTLQVHQFPCLSDNYGYLLHDPDSGETACIDTPDAEAYLREAAANGWQITQIWNTHWHPDHAGGNEAIKAATGCTVIAPLGEVDKIAGIDRAVVQGDTVKIGAYTAHVIDVGGHTMGHIAYHVPEAGIASTLLGWCIGLLIAWMPLYLLLMQKRVYAQGWPMTLLKYFVLGTIYMTLLGFAITGAALASLVWM